MAMLRPGRRLASEALRSGILALALAACGGDDAAAPDEAGGHDQIQGAVALIKTGDPIPNAVVALLDGPRVLRAAVTDASGKFAFDGVRAGHYQLHLTGLELTGVSLLYTSFEPRTQDITLADAPITVYFGGEGIVPAQVTGFVTCAGAAAPGARVRIVGGETDTTVTTTDLGRFASGGLGAGNYAVLLAQPPAGCSFPQSFQVAAVRPGQLARLDFDGGR